MVERLGSADEVSRVIDTLSAGRFALARVAARLAGEPLPASPTPCFFDPRHGPATTEVLWTRPGRGSRRVPACRQDAARHAAGDEPEVRYLQIDGRRIPVWEAGALLQPYTHGYFPTTVTEGRRDAQAQGAVWHLPDHGTDGPGSFLTPPRRLGRLWVSPGADSAGSECHQAPTRPVQGVTKRRLGRF